MIERDNVHLARESYETLTALLKDLQRVTHDLRAVAYGQLLVPVYEIDFLTRRADYLAAGGVACIEEIRVIPHSYASAEES